MTIRDLQDALALFARERDWEQFHTPKNLAMALAGEAGEVLELFQWLTPEQSSALTSRPDEAQALRQELADVFAYLLRLADVTGIDLEEALAEKIELNRRRYPVELAYGRAEKYTKLGE
ncbi:MULTISPECIES: nucleotide pyrophosphohydrolase [unclassified Streptomyces]|uniref:nucleotide pyrophosphohydrolase n=1 Tax=unclassified Streptomyces TaxID=2593676 RepID=UPI0011634651|nr:MULTISPECIES: nucleotide pyrophosphohydrolase [unclassified Streptomyces]NMI54256.1 nucleotide pyrophosphohydrolase [Streptomyces sp. RLA2-12]QDN63144.1 nucleotide pyrophosphohydrolase [Streptomyces sp. S1D4-20]QDN73196.1 nucleotide pyrophosphohydrolase [Streptomyces sp. S1D4-14]QDO55794.1 nucleotide pyrophosphohydrolase [Streptomyces sp. RLB3-5]QDO56936.1 nucleotide pyrophosphohydrolase [Streptomyces sp. RLB1-8]